MITCIAIDDEPLALKQLEKYIKKTPFLQLVAACPSALKAKEIYETNPVDVIYTDINMPDCDGLQFVKSLAKHPLIVFSTAYEKYAIESYRVDAIDYLLKPYSYQEFFKSALKVKQYIEWQQAVLEDYTDIRSNDFFVRADNRNVKVQIDNILYIESMSEYVRIHFVEGKSIMTYMSIKLMMDSLPSDAFMRSHRSYIIALKHITSFRKTEVELTGGVTLPVSNSYRDDLQKYIEKRTVFR